MPVARWQVLEPGLKQFAEVSRQWGVDVEYLIWQSLAEFWCADFFRTYMKVRFFADISTRQINIQQAFRHAQGNASINKSYTCMPCAHE